MYVWIVISINVEINKVYIGNDRCFWNCSLEKYWFCCNVVKLFVCLKKIVVYCGIFGFEYEVMWVECF